ncbi:hypothetical protein Nepgr_001822 [Nepenthes gracilis]|uniref:F-box domain-containing protein n=1 Tax=Nepenthes gracilis TaxID=150966 RepID=A0AAD3P5T0_NEPGR|nr:hypothetical protein Nepgr_001822 [Nepenthes gracilis]
MILPFLTCISFILFVKSLSLGPLPPWACDMRFLPLCFWKELPFFIPKAIKKSVSGCSTWFPWTLSMEKRNPGSNHENVENNGQISLLDLPELTLECILERLSPAALCHMAGVCSSLRERCTSDHLWQRHMEQKWGGVIGHAAYLKWQLFSASRKNSIALEGLRPQGLIRFMGHAWPFSFFRSKFDHNSKKKTSLPVDSAMSWYLALETGSFWFPAQVFNRENGHLGFLLSCYDAELSYEPQTDTFQARYPPHGRRAMAVESGVQWERLRAPPVDTSPHVLHISDCLNDLRPGDHFEIQWRRNKEFPYGWWYGVVGHLESCDGNQLNCRCHSSDTVVLEFNQYAAGSQWRRASISRKEHGEVGNEADGFYGGIRKLYKNDEISTWKMLWPTQVLE